MTQHLSAAALLSDVRWLRGRARAAIDHELAEMRRYVPAPIADQISTGESLEFGESDVTVMFIDLRGYTAFAETLSPEQTFAFVNRYTQTVSRIVRRHGGFVVEFNGDGMMAVFGALVRQPRKEREALGAARAISKAVRTLGPQPICDPPHRVGIGIATGPAYMGNIRAVDRTIWSAVGTTTNRASRLQALTRDLGASIIVDAATRKAAGPAPGFSRHAPVAIQGLREPVELFALPRH